MEILFLRFEYLHPMEASAHLRISWRKWVRLGTEHSSVFHFQAEGSDNQRESERKREKRRARLGGSVKLQLNRRASLPRDVGVGVGAQPGSTLGACK